MMEIVQALANESHRRIEIREGDYKKDGILYCGMCHTPKQFNKQVGDIWINSLCLCKCQKAAYEREEAAWAKKTQDRERYRRRISCFPVASMAEMTWDKDDNARPLISQMCRRYCDNFADARKDGAGLLIYGGVGTGKSFLAACIANRLIDDGYSVVFDNARGYADKSFDDKEYFLDIITQTDLLILDDLGMERNTEFMRETVFQILDKRCQAGKPILVTTNLTNDQLKNPGSIEEERVFSRLLESTVPILLKGEDRRRTEGMKTAKEWREILNG